MRKLDTMPLHARSAAPALAPGFAWTAGPWGHVLECAPLAAVARHGWTTRELAIASETGQSEAQWHQLARAAGVDPRALAALHQVHGAAVIDARDAGRSPSPTADGIVTGDPSLLLTVRVADCVPLLLADMRLGVVAAVHAGWRGTAAGIACAAVTRLRELYDSQPRDVVAALGPSIGPCCYTVGEELTHAFHARGHTERDVGRWFSGGASLQLDLWTANRDQLLAAGVPARAVFVSRLCTACHPAWFYSYRREGAAAGRLVGFIRPLSRDDRSRA